MISSSLNQEKAINMIKKILVGRCLWGNNRLFASRRLALRMYVLACVELYLFFLLAS